MPDDDTTAADGFADAFTPWPVFVEKHFPMPPGRRRSKRSERDLARKYGARKGAIAFMRSHENEKTPDGAKYSRHTVELAMRGLID